MIAVVVFVRPPWPLTSEIGFYVESAGYLFLLAGLAVRIWCIFYIGGRKSKELITQGPYSICRNPLYVGTFLLAVGAGLCFENLLFLALCVIMIIPAHLLVVRMEEDHLDKIFGNEYRTYKQRVPRYWPRFSSYQSPKTLTVPVLAIRRIATDTILVLFLPVIEDLLEILHNHNLIPVFWHFP